jgi:diacylglycerol kinase family enzyme
LIHSLKRQGLRPRVFSRRERLDEWLADRAHRERLACIVAAGGDGTFRDLCNRFPTIPIAVLPLGTENLVARHLCIPRCGQAVADMIASRQVQRLDLGTLGERRFAVMASVGFDADVIHRAHSRRRGHISRLSYLQPICESLRTYAHPDLRIWVDDRPEPYVAKLAVIVNLPAYALGLRLASSARGDDGTFDLRLFQRGSAFQMWRYFFKVMGSRHERLSDVQAVQGSRIRIESDVPVPVQLDGDPAGWTPAEFQILPGAAEVLVPRAVSAGVAHS